MVKEGTGKKFNDLIVSEALGFVKREQNKLSKKNKKAELAVLKL